MGSTEPPPSLVRRRQQPPHPSLPRLAPLPLVPPQSLPAPLVLPSLVLPRALRLLLLDLVQKEWSSSEARHLKLELVVEQLLLP